MKNLLCALAFTISGTFSVSAQEFQNRFTIPESTDVEEIHVYRASGEEINSDRIYDPESRVVDMNLLPKGTYMLNIEASNAQDNIIQKFVVLKDGKGIGNLTVKGDYYNYWVSLKSPDTQEARINRMLKHAETAIQEVLNKNGCVVHTLNTRVDGFRSNDAYRYNIFIDWNLTCNTMDQLKIEIDLPAWFFSHAYVIIQPYSKGQLNDYIKVRIE